VPMAVFSRPDYLWKYEGLQIIKRVGNNQRNTNSYCVSQQSGYRYGHTEISRREKLYLDQKVNTILKISLSWCNRKNFIDS
jgi:hypothetical protein